jgi:hypothetical protein
MTALAFPDVWLLDHRLPLDRIGVAFVVTGLFGIGGYVSRGVTRSGALAGAILAFVLYVAAGPQHSSPCSASSS